MTGGDLCRDRRAAWTYFTRYPADERHHALREVIQDIALGLQRARCFDRAAF